MSIIPAFVARPVPAGLSELLNAQAVPNISLEDACANCSHLDGDDVDYPKVSCRSSGMHDSTD